MDAIDPVTSPLLHAWIPALEVAERRLRRGARVAEIGVAAASAAIPLALAYPASTFHGFDADADVVATIRGAIARAGLSDRVTYEVLRRGALGSSRFDLVRDPGSRSSEIRPARGALRPGGVWIGAGADGVTVRPRSALLQGW